MQPVSRAVRIQSQASSSTAPTGRLPWAVTPDRAPLDEKLTAASSLCRGEPCEKKV